MSQSSNEVPSEMCQLKALAVARLQGFNSSSKLKKKNFLDEIISVQDGKRFKLYQAKLHF